MPVPKLNRPPRQFSLREKFHVTLERALSNALNMPNDSSSQHYNFFFTASAAS